MADSNSILSLLDNFTLINSDDIALTIAGDFRKRRIEKGFTRKQFAEKAGVPAPTLTRFEQKGLISLTNLIKLAIGLGYPSEITRLNIASDAGRLTGAELRDLGKYCNLADWKRISSCVIY